MCREEADGKLTDREPDWMRDRKRWQEDCFALWGRQSRHWSMPHCIVLIYYVHSVFACVCVFLWLYVCLHVPGICKWVCVYFLLCSVHDPKCLTKLTAIRTILTFLLVALSLWPCSYCQPKSFFFWHNKTDFWKSLGSKKHHMKSGLQSAICVTRNTAKKQQHQLQSAGSAGIHAATSRAPKNLLTHMPSPQRTMQIGWWRLDTHIRFDHLQITVCIKGSHLRTKSDLPAVWTTS